MISILLVAIILIALITLCLLVFIRNPRNITNRSFSLLVLFSSIWIASNFLENEPFFSKTTRTWLLHLDFAAASFIGYYFLRFCMNFPRQNKISLPKRAPLFLMACFFFGTSFSKLVITDIKFHEVEGIDFEISVLFLPYALFVAGSILGACIHLFHKLRKSRGIKRGQIRYVLLGLFLSATIALTLNLLVPRLMVVPIEVLRFGIYSLLFLVGFTVYAIIKHRLWDIRLVFVKSLVYSLIILSIASIYVFVIFYLVEPIKETFKISPNLTFVLTGFLIAFGFNPFKKLIERLTDRIFYKGRYHPGKLLERLGKIMSSTLLLEPLVDSLLKTILKEMRVKKGAFVLTQSPQLKEIKKIGYSKVSLSTWKKLSPFIQRKELLVRDELEEESKEKKLLRKLDISVISPFFMEKEPLGILVLGEKKSGDMYSLQDLNFLEVLSPQVSIALRNGKLFKKEQKKVLELNSLNKLSSSLVKTLDLQTLLDQVVEQALKVTAAQSGSIMLLNEETQTLLIKASQGISPEIVKKTKLKLGEGIAGYVAKEGKPLILSGKKKTPFREELKRKGLTSSLTVPLKTKEKVVGVLNINREQKEPFLEEDLNLISSFAAQAAVSIENARLYTEATTDGLTSLYNHNYFQLKLTEKVTRAKRNSSPLSLLMIDIDHFKVLNDSFGHQKGDTVLKELSKILKSNISPKAIASRYGGEEFTIILPQKEIKEAEDLAETLRKKVETHNFSETPPKLKTTISIGVSTLSQILKNPQGKESPKEFLIKKADEALYLAKQAGRNQVKTASFLNQPIQNFS